MRHFLGVFICIIFINKTFAQNKKFTMTEAVNGLSTTLAPAKLKQLSWMGNSTKQYAQVVTKDSIDFFVKTTLPDCNTETMFSLPKLNESLQAKNMNALKKMPNAIWLSENYFYYVDGQQYIGVNYKNSYLSSELLFTVPEDAENIALEKTSMTIAYSSNNNLFIQKKGEKPTQITKDGSYNIVYGAGKVHQNEFGIDKVIFWSPDGNLLAFYRMDQTNVTDYPVIDWSVNPAKSKNMKYPFAGGVSHEVTLQCYNVKTSAIITMDTGEPKDQYLTSITWHPNCKNIYIGLLNRDQNDFIMNKYDATTGKFVKTIFNEKHPKYVEPQHPLYFIPELKNEVIYWSQKDGYMHLYRLNEETGALHQITKGKWVVNEWIGYNIKNHEIIFTSSMDGAMHKQVYAVDVMDNEIRKLNRVNGWHTVTANANNTFLIDEYSNTKEPKVVDILGIEGDYEKRILTAKPTITDYAIATVKQVTLFASDSTKLYGKLMLPADIDTNKKYPVIVYLYNGPHVQLIKNSYPESGNLWYDYMTQNGYVVFVMDGRGSGNRGFNFESATFGKLGSVEMEDQLKGVNFLKSLPFVDSNRMGIHGWSFGGFMTTSFMLRNPNVFKVGVAGGPVLNWQQYEIMYTERYMDSPEKNPTGYSDNNLMTKTKNLKGKLLLIHGTDDDTVVWENSIDFLKKCVDTGTQVDYFVYPGHAHNVRGKDRVHLMQKVTDYFNEYLK